jgi:hypothetical protein
MKRETSLLLVLGLLSTIVPPLFAQDPQGRPDPVPPSNDVGSQLIVWSEVQKPQPIPQPARNPGEVSKLSDQDAQRSGNSSAQQTEAHSASGNYRQAR